MAVLDVRPWNLAAPTLLGVIACGPGRGGSLGTAETGASETTETSSESETTGAPTETDTDTDTETETGDEPDDPPCESDADCPPQPCNCYYYCYDVCYYVCSAGECVDAPPECYASTDCEPGEFCAADECASTIFELLDCVDPPLLEIPLPPFEGPVLDLSLADVDGDARDELVLLAGGMVRVIDGDQVISSGPVPATGDQLAVLRVDADAHLDVVIGDRDSADGALLLGAGDGSFSVAPGGPGRAVDRLAAIDWPSGGTQELAAVAPDGSAAWVLSGLDSPTPTELAFEPPVGVADLAVADFGDGVDSLVTTERCSIVRYTQIGEGFVETKAGPEDRCVVAIGDLAAYPFEEIATLLVANGFSYVWETTNYGIGTALYRLEGEYTDLLPVQLDGVPSPELILIGPQPPYLIRGQYCGVSLAALPPATRIAAGDLDGDGNEELVLLDELGAVRVWTDDD